MTYRVNIHPLAERDFRTFYHYIEERSPDGAIAWGEAFEDAKERLKQNPNIYSEIPDPVSGQHRYQQVFFKTRYGDRYRAVYLVDGRQVTILRIRGKGQLQLTEEDLPYG